MQIKDLELKLLLGSLLWFIFTSLAVNPSLGWTYGVITTAALFMFIVDKKKELVLDRDNKWIQGIFWGAVTYGVFLVLSPVLVSLLVKIDIGGIIALLASSTPPLATSKIVNFLTFTFPIAFVETTLWARMVDFFVNRLKISKSQLLNFAAWAVILSFSFLFLLYHIQSKGLTNNSALALVFIMMITSYIVMFIFRETKQAIFFHIIANGIASYMLFFNVGGLF